MNHMFSLMILMFSSIFTVRVAQANCKAYLVDELDGGKVMKVFESGKIFNQCKDAMKKCQKVLNTLEKERFACLKKQEFRLETGPRDRP